LIAICQGTLWFSDIKHCQTHAHLWPSAIKFDVPRKTLRTFDPPSQLLIPELALENPKRMFNPGAGARFDCFQLATRPSTALRLLGRMATCQVTFRLPESADAHGAAAYAEHPLP